MHPFTKCALALAICGFFREGQADSFTPYPYDLNTNFMKKLSFLLFFLLLLGARLQATEVGTSSKVSAVTVYRNMARETRTCITNIPAGNTEVVLTGVSMEMIDQSIQVAVKGDAVLLSASVRTNYFQDMADAQIDPRAIKLQDSLKAINKEMRWIAEEKSVHAGELSLLDALLKSGAVQKDYKPGDLNACADIYRTRTMELKKKIFDLQIRLEQLEENVARYDGQLAEMGPKERSPVKEIVLNFWSEIPVAGQIKCMYLVSNAGWVPMYDLNVENTSQPVEISYKAGVFQRTGNDWKNVDLTISTSTPALNNDRPILSPRYVDFVSYNLTPASGMVTATNSMYVATNLANQPSLVVAPNPFEYAVNVAETDIHVEYEIEIKQNIPSDANHHICKLKDYNVPATYRYHTVPKLESAAFLLARITDYGQYNLLAGRANVFFADTYIGQVTLNPQVTGDTLLVSLGRDERIVVKRTRIQEKVSKRILDSKEKENFAYKITIRNNKGVPIEIEVLDQVPMSRTKEIVVDLVNKSGADYEKDYGRLLWQLKIDANKSKTLDLIYTIESPEGKSVAEQ
jgi:uncharacterized protein (TIGR02231 family)